MVTILGDDRAKSVKYITDEAIKKCSKQVIDIVRNGSMVIILPNTISNIVDKYGYESDKHLEMLNNIQNICKDANIILNFDNNTRYTTKREVSGWVFTQSFGDSLIKNNNLQIKNSKNIELELNNNLIIGDYKSINSYNNTRNRLNYIFINNLFRFNPRTLNNADFKQPVEIIGYYKNISNKSHVISMNISKINYKSIIQLINITL